MKLLAILFTIVASPLFSQATYNLFKTTITCEKDKGEVVSSGNTKINDALNMLVKDGQLVAFTADRSDEKEKIKLITPLQQRTRPSSRR